MLNNQTFAIMAKIKMYFPSLSPPVLFSGGVKFIWSDVGDAVADEIWMGWSGWCGSVFPEMGEARVLYVGTARDEGVTVKEVTDDREPMNTSKAAANNGIERGDLRIVMLDVALGMEQGNEKEDLQLMKE
mmetsp:Transcript_11828/g.21002  ORF Transcript_11828/g.21002 Transcript_11828/m.21002 type:complete len:130 (-) Transcript_11828:17-406(-)